MEIVVDKMDKVIVIEARSLSNTDNASSSSAMITKTNSKEQDSQRLQGCNKVADDIDIIDISDDSNDCLTDDSNSCNDEGSVSVSQNRCLLCGEAYSTFANLKEHLLTHSYKKPNSGVSSSTETTELDDVDKVRQHKVICNPDLSQSKRGKENICISETRNNINHSRDSLRALEDESNQTENVRNTFTDASSKVLKDSEPGAQHPLPLNLLWDPGVEKVSPNPTRYMIVNSAATTTTEFLPKKQVPAKPYSCPICYKNLSKSYVSTHLKLHSGEKPYRCNLCDKSYVTKSKLKYHASKKHKGLDAQDRLVSGNLHVNNNNNIGMTKEQDNKVTYASEMKDDAISLLQKSELSDVPGVVTNSSPVSDLRHQVDNEDVVSETNNQSDVLPSRSLHSPENEVLLSTEKEGKASSSSGQASDELYKTEGLWAVAVNKGKKCKTQEIQSCKNSKGNGKKRKSHDAPANSHSQSRVTRPLEGNQSIKCGTKPTESVGAPIITIVDEDDEKLHSGEKPYQCNLCDKSYVTQSKLKYHASKNHKGLDAQDRLVSGNLHVNNNNNIGMTKEQDNKVTYASEMKDDAISLLQKNELNDVPGVLTNSSSVSDLRHQVANENYSSETNNQSDVLPSRSLHSPENEVLVSSEKASSSSGQASDELYKTEGLWAVAVNKGKKCKTQEIQSCNNSKGNGKKRKSHNAPANSHSQSRVTRPLEGNQSIKCGTKPTESVGGPIITIGDEDDEIVVMETIIKKKCLGR